ncbi:hypothetical protein [Shinella sp. DD12]|uniref:hypothetical protein n=1 Tax=Shinella sp. DD12 TaxID=1410620 RepID=UPI000437BC33|nr:hypothetical protein [Shinella sp. DD12]EYR84251.1 hypothetical protein SHLA_14c000330 [Shinella sp. DD12]
MSERGTTNFLLAIIAAALLFGSGAVLGAFQWGLALAAVLLFAYVVLAGARALIGVIWETVAEAKANGRESLFFTLGGICIFVIGAAISGYSGLLWLDGDKEPVKSAMTSWLGTALAILTGLLVVGAFVFAARFVFTWVAERREFVPAFFLFSGAMLLRSPLAPVLLPVYLWRVSRRRNEGLFICTVEALLGLVVGLVVFLVLTVLVVAVYQALTEA